MNGNSHDLDANVLFLNVEIITLLTQMCFLGGKIYKSALSVRISCH